MLQIQHLARDVICIVPALHALYMFLVTDLAWSVTFAMYGCHHESFVPVSIKTRACLSGFKQSIPLVNC